MSVDRTPHGTPVQRLAIPDGLLDRVRSLLGGADGELDRGDGEASDAESKADTDAQQKETEAETHVTNAENDADTDARGASEDAETDAAGAVQEGEDAASDAREEDADLTSLTEIIPDAVSPVGAPSGGAAPAGGPEGGGGGGGGPAPAATSGGAAARNAPGPPASPATGPRPRTTGGTCQAASGARRQVSNAAQRGAEATDCDAGAVLDAFGEGAMDAAGAAFDRAKQWVGDRLAQLRQLVGKVGATILRGAATVVNAVAGGIDKASKAIGAAARAVADKARQIAGAVRDRLRAVGSRVKGVVEGIGRRAKQMFDRVSSGAKRLWDGLVGGVRRAVGGKASRAREMIGRLWSIVPGPIKSIVTGAASKVTSFAQRVRQKAQALGSKLRAAGQRIGQRVRSGIDALKSKVESLGERVKSGIKAGVDKIRALKDSVVQGLRSTGNGLNDLADRTEKSTRAKLDDRSAQREQELMGKVCAPVGKAAGPCVDDLLMDMGKGGENKHKFYITGNVDIPLRPPLQLRLGGGASVEIKRTEGSEETGDKFTVTLSAEGNVAGLLATPGDPNASPGVDISTPGNLEDLPQLVKAIKALGGGGGAGPPGKASASVEAGVRGTVSAAFEFSRDGDDTTCDGVGGMVTFLAALGVNAGAAGSPLPMPLRAALGAGSGAALEAFTDRATELKFRYAPAYVKGEAGASVPGIDLKGEGAAEQFVETTIKLNQDADGDGTDDGTSMSVEVGDKMSLKVGGGIGIPEIMNLVRGGLSGELTRSITLNLVQGDEVTLDVSKVGITAKASGSINKTTLRVLAPALPSGAESALERRMDQLGAADVPVIGTGGQFGIEVTVSAMVHDVGEILTNIRSYLDRAGESATKEGVLNTLAGLLEGVSLVVCTTVKVFETDKFALKADVKAKQGGGSVEIGDEHTRSVVIGQTSTRTTLEPGTPGTPDREIETPVPGTPARHEETAAQFSHYPTEVSELAAARRGYRGELDKLTAWVRGREVAPDSTFGAVITGWASPRWRAARDSNERIENNNTLASERASKARPEVHEAIAEGGADGVRVTVGAAPIPPATGRDDNNGAGREDNGPELRKADVLVSHDVPEVPATTTTEIEEGTEGTEGGLRTVHDATACKG